MLDELNYHNGCSETRCPICQANNKVLEDILYDALGDSCDWLGRYHAWLRSEGIEPETEGGWWSKDALNDANVQRFISMNSENEIQEIFPGTLNELNKLCERET